MQKTFIREIFFSIQGEGPHVGEPQLFIRFSKCNLNCKYCDTDFNTDKSKEYTSTELIDIIKTYGNNLTLSLTGGEPLLDTDFLEEFLPIAKNAGHRIYLETNGTLPDKLEKIIDYVDIVSADIKLKSSTGIDIDYKIFDKFFKISDTKETFAKIVFDKNITEIEISSVIELSKKYNIEIILQPMMIGDKFASNTEFNEKIFNKFYNKYKNVRIIPQMHKFLNVR